MTEHHGGNSLGVGKAARCRVEDGGELEERLGEALRYTNSWEPVP